MGHRSAAGGDFRAAPAHLLHGVGQLEGEPAAGLGAAEQEVEKRLVAGPVGGKEYSGAFSDLRHHGRSFQVDGDHRRERVENCQNRLQLKDSHAPGRGFAAGMAGRRPLLASAARSPP